MSSGGLVFSASDLQDASQAFGAESGKFGGIGSGVPTASGADFGTLSVCQQLSSLASQVTEACGTEFSAADTWLSATSQALGEARKAYMAAEAANTAAAKTA